jgi:hypothetical protein
VVRDVYIPARYGDEGSHLSPARTFAEFPPLLFRAWWRRVITQYFVRDFSVASLFLLAGIVGCCFGGVCGAYYWILSYQRGVVATTGQVMLAVLPLILGAQLLLQALVMDVQSVPREPIHLAQRVRVRT